MPYKILEHTADFRLLVSGRNLPDLFESAFLGTTDYLKEREGDEKNTISQKIRVEAPDETSLLIDFLNEVLSLAHINNEIYRAVSFTKITNQFLEAEIKGHPVDSFDHDIKAVTYHEADIKMEDNLLKTKIVFDI
ncbi:MAG TPA: archease [Candidatus Paceibacterota bacterium]|nr:archease [Candidatus Paceibacterota bacterium]